MDLLLAVVQDADVSRLLARLHARGITVTRLASTGGFLWACRTRRTEQVIRSKPPQVGQVTLGGAVVFALRVEEVVRV